MSCLARSSPSDSIFNVSNVIGFCYICLSAIRKLTIVVQFDLFYFIIILSYMLHHCAIKSKLNIMLDQGHQIGPFKYSISNLPSSPSLCREGSER